MVKRKAQKQTGSKRQMFLILGCITLFVCIWFIFSNKHSDLQQEAEGFAKLKSDFLTLQSEFNKIDPGWKYSEGCTGSGGVFDRDKATDCTLVNTLATIPLVQAKKILRITHQFLPLLIIFTSKRMVKT